MTDKNKEIHHSEFDDRELEVTEFDLESFEIPEYEWREVEKEVAKKIYWKVWKISKSKKIKVSQKCGFFLI